MSDIIMYSFAEFVFRYLLTSYIILLNFFGKKPLAHFHLIPFPPFSLCALPPVFDSVTFAATTLL